MMMKRKKLAAVIRCGGCFAGRDGRMHQPGCPYGCPGEGNCAAVCPRQAISFRENGSAVVDRGLCTGCGKCVEVCPQQLIDLVPAENTIQPFCSRRLSSEEKKTICPAGCIGCGICEKVCPSGAIAVKGRCAVIDQTRCIACGMCAARCPRSVIHDANGIIAII